MTSSDFEECSGLVLATGRAAAAPAAAAGSKFAGVEDIQGLGVTLETPGGFGSGRSYFCYYNIYVNWCSYSYAE